jgi:hypothetical protein
MSKRLQVLVPDDEYRKFQRQARQAKVSLGEWVRSVLRRVNDSESDHSIEDRLELIREAFTHQGPASDLEQMNAEIERGYLKQ